MCGIIKLKLLFSIILHDSADYAEWLMIVALILRNLRRYDEAKTLFERALEITYGIDYWMENEAIVSIVFVVFTL